MEELDLLKKYWNKTEFPKIKTDELRKMIQKRSSSTLKWILIISILEFVFWLALNIMSNAAGLSNQLAKDLGPESHRLIYLAEYISYFIFYPVIIYFMVHFFRLYRSISVTDNTTSLTKSILTTNKLVRRYIAFNIVFIFLNMLVGGIIGLSIQNQEGFTQVNWLVNTISIFFILIFIGVIIGVLWVFYRVLYGWLLRRLNKNYQELIKIEEITEK